MAQVFIKTAFASSGDVSTIPDAVQPDGSVSFTQGWGPDYQADPSNPAVLYPERRIMNEILLLLSENIQLLQVHGFPDYILAAQNGGVNYSYDINAFVRWTDGNVYYSLANTNTADPSDATKWAMFIQPSPFKTGMTIIHEDTTVPTGGWVWANGQTIGNAASGATGRANADTAALFAQIWAAFPNSVRPIQTSTGSLSTRGANAAADYAANKRIPLRDMRDVVPAGTGTMGGTTDRGLLTASNTLGVDGSVFGATGGEQEHSQALNEMIQHSHSASGLTTSTWSHSHNVALKPGGPSSDAPQNTGATSGGTINYATSSVTSPALSISGSIGNAGGADPFNVVQPTTICNFITKL